MLPKTFSRGPHPDFVLSLENSGARLGCCLFFHSSMVRSLHWFIPFLKDSTHKSYCTLWFWIAFQLLQKICWRFSASAASSYFAPKSICNSQDYIFNCYKLHTTSYQELFPGILAFSVILIVLRRFSTELNFRKFWSKTRSLFVFPLFNGKITPLIYTLLKGFDPQFVLQIVHLNRFPVVAKNISASLGLSSIVIFRSEFNLQVILLSSNFFL